MRPSLRAARHSWIMLLLLALGGCSTFNREWKEAGRHPLPPNDVRGRWEGAWLSDVNGHTGRLRCLLSRIEDHRYQARFRATFWKIFRYSYKALLVLEPANDKFDLRGEADLGWLAGGVYRYEGTVTPTNFFSTYSSKQDHGTFRMSRPSE